LAVVLLDRGELLEIPLDARRKLVALVPEQT
jgi:hypothetical protein